MWFFALFDLYFEEIFSYTMNGIYESHYRIAMLANHLRCIPVYLH